MQDSDHFDQVLRENDDKLIIIDFSATWCKPCQQLEPIFRILSLKTPVALFLKVDINECDELAQKFEIQSLPTIKFIRSKRQTVSSIVNEANSLDLYKTEITKNRASGRLLIFEFHAPYSAHVCEPVKQILSNIVDEYPSSVRVVRVNIDRDDNVRDSAGVTNLPAVHFWFEGSKIDSIAGKTVSSKLSMSRFLF